MDTVWAPIHIRIRIRTHTQHVSSVSTNLVLTTRKALSLCFSVWWFGNGWNAQLGLGAGMVFLGSLLYTFVSSAPRGRGGGATSRKPAAVAPGAEDGKSDAKIKVEAKASLTTGMRAEAEVQAEARPEAARRRKGGKSRAA